MNTLFHWCLLLTGVAGCHAAAVPAPASVDPFLGHWRADTERLVRYTAAGQINHNTTSLTARNSTLPPPPTHQARLYPQWGPAGGAHAPRRVQCPYGRGNWLSRGALRAWAGQQCPVLMRRYVRVLTPTGFTLETVHGFSLGPTSQRCDSFVDFHC